MLVFEILKYVCSDEANKSGQFFFFEKALTQDSVNYLEQFYIASMGNNT